MACSKIINKINAYIFSKPGINKMIVNLGNNLNLIKYCYNPCVKSCKMTKCKKNRKK